jgi:peroxiredoxin
MTASEKSFHDFTLQGIDGKAMPLAQFKGKVVLLVNTASECSYTPQYEALEELWLANKDKGLVVAFRQMISGPRSRARLARSPHSANSIMALRFR